MTLSRREFLASLAGLTVLRPTASYPAGRYGLAGKIFTGDASPVIHDHAVLINGSRIEDIVPYPSVTDRPVITFPDACILPGIVNAHCHRTHSSEDRRERWLEHGVTSIGDVGSPLAALKQLSRSPTGTTTTAARSGPILSPPGGYPLPVHSTRYAMEISSPQEGTDAVRKLADHGATMVKIAFEPGPRQWPVFDVKTAGAICSAARRIDLTVRCHVEDLSGLEPALDSGVHTVEHVPHRWFKNGERHPVLTKNGEVVPYYRSLLERMRRDNVILTPTIDVLARSPWNGPELYEPVKTFHAMGGRIALGNDFPYRRTDSGMPLAEMRLLAKAGLDKEDVLNSSTRIAAMASGFTDRGVIAPGMTADLLMVAGDPTKDLAPLINPLHILKDGVFIR